MSFLSTEWVKYDYTVSYLQGSVVWVSARATKLPTWAEIMFVFEAPVWIIFFFSIILTNITWVTLAYCRNPQTDRLNLILDIYSILIQNPSANPDAIPIRTLHITWIWCTMVIAGSFNGVFFALQSSNDIYGQEIHTIEAAINAPGSKFIFTNFQSEAHVSSYSERQIMRSNWINCASMTSCLKITAGAKHIFMMGPRETIEINLPDFVDEEGNQLLYILINPIKTVDYRMLLRPGYPLTEFLNLWFHRMNEVGFFKLWTQRFSTYFAIRRQDSKNRKAEKPLGFQHVLIAFLLLIGGNLLSVFVFILEKTQKWRPKCCLPNL